MRYQLNKPQGATECTLAPPHVTKLQKSFVQFLVNLSDYVVSKFHQNGICRSQNIYFGTLRGIICVCVDGAWTEKKTDQKHSKICLNTLSYEAKWKSG